MNCRDLEPAVAPYLDEELVDEERIEVEAHVAACATCAKRVEVERHNLTVLRTLGRQSPPAPEALKARLRTSLDGVHVSARRRRAVAAFAAAAGIVLVANIGVQQYRSFQRRLYVDDVATRHARQFPLEIRQPSTEALEAWFGGKLDHRVSVPRLPNATAAGARILNVRDHQAAYIRYDAPRKKGSEAGQVGLFVYGDKPRELDVGALGDAEVGNSNGYNVVSWRDGDVVYQLVTDLDEDDIKDLLPGQGGGEAPAVAMPPPAALDVRPVSLER